MRADRLIRLMLLLNTRGRQTARRLAEELEVTERTIYRDVQALGTAGVPFNALTGPAGGIWLDEQYRVSLTGMTRDQIRSLFLASAAGPVSDLGLARVLDDALLKLFAALPLPHRDDVTRLRQRFHVDPIDWFDGGEAMPYFSALQQAVWEDRRIQVTYQTGESVVFRGRLDPYGLAAKAAIWYLVGRKRDSTYRTYRVSRFGRVGLTASRFERDPHFDLARYWQVATEAFERRAADQIMPFPAVLRIHPGVAWRISGEAYGPVERLGLPDVQGWLTLRVTFPSAEEARWCVLSLGPSVQVLGPAELDWAVAEAARAVVAAHEPAGSGPSMSGA